MNRLTSAQVISELRIQNFKSIKDIRFRPGRVSVLIGENGSGKSNILEAITFGAAASSSKLDNEFLINRGIRVTDHEWMCSAFPRNDEKQTEIDIAAIAYESSKSDRYEGIVFHKRITPVFRPDDPTHKSWTLAIPEAPEEISKIQKDPELLQAVEKLRSSLKLSLVESGQPTAPVAPEKIPWDLVATILLERTQQERSREAGFSDFLIYAPENAILRTPPPEGAIQPVGVKGEGLFKLLQSFAEAGYEERLSDLKDRLHLFGWFEDLLLPDATATAQAMLKIKDRWLGSQTPLFDQRSANEGFLYVLFYFALLISWRTPRFFSIDNVDNGLNPKMCVALMRQIAELAKKYDKQVICTTHNPAILDGLNLNDEEQRLFTVSRDSEGRTRLNRVSPPSLGVGEAPVKLSHAFLSGYIGGLPENF